MNETKFTRGKTMLCPHCGGEVSVGFECELSGDLKALPQEGLTFTDQEKEMLDQAEKAGLLKAFEQAQLGSRPEAQLPKDMRRLFIQFFQKATPKAIPAWALDYFIDEFRPGRIEVWGAEGVAAILVDRAVKVIVPYKLIRGESISSLGGRSGSKGRIDADEGEFYKWIRTKHGYVVGNGAFFKAMQQKSRGDFAKLVM